MKKILGILCAALIGFSVASAEVLWYVPVDGMETGVECWNGETCAPVTSTAYLSQYLTGVTAVYDAEYIGIGGYPPVFRFKLAQDNAMSFFYFDSLTVDFEGPGFAYHMVGTFEPETFWYVDGIPMPGPTVEVPPGDGCVPVSYGYEWTWDNPAIVDGEVALTEDFIVPEGETLVIDPGIHVYSTGAYKIIVNGDIEVNGEMDSKVHFGGMDWLGIELSETGDGYINHAIITGVEGASAVNVANHVIMRYCLVYDNHTTGNGGGINVIGGTAMMHSCTFVDNTADGEGQNAYIATGCAVGGYYTLFAYGSFVSVDDEISTMQYSAFYPLDGLDPGAVAYTCDPGFVDRENHDYNISFWSVEDPEEISCLIDVSIISVDDDPDGTPKDIGALPFDQHNVLLSAEIAGVYDIPNDQGGCVYIEVAPSPNDGSAINPISAYGIWRMDGEIPVFVNSILATGGMDNYFVQVPTIVDSVDVDNPGITSFYVTTHYMAMIAYSGVYEGWSVDNLAPAAVTSFTSAEQFDYSPTWEELWGTGENPDHLLTDVAWDACTAVDFDHYVVRARLNGAGDGEVVYAGSSTDFTHSADWNELVCDTGDHFEYEIAAVDVHNNVSEYTYVDGPVCVGVADATVPAEFSLEQNYPNPFNPTTTIAYTLPTASDVSLKVYNVLGAEVLTLVNQNQAAGRYEVVMDASALASGMYFYRIHAGEYTSLHKMVLVK